MSGALGAILINQIAKARNKKAISKELKQSIDIIEKYLIYIKEHPDDQDADAENSLESTLIAFNKLT
jgi:hypothetical protein